MGTPRVFNPSPDEAAKAEGHRSDDRLLLDLITWVGRDPGLNPPTKAVFLAVVAHADHGVCTATDEALARASRTSVPTVQRNLKLFEGERVFRRSYRPNDAREIRLLPGEQSLVVVDELEGGREKEQQQHRQQSKPRDCSPVSSPLVGGHPGIDNDVDEEFERLVALLTAWKVTRPVAERLVRDYPERIERQVEAHRHRNVTNPAGSLVAAIRGNWPTEIPEPQRQPTAEERRQAGRRAREAERDAALQAQAAENARKRAEEREVRSFWEAMPPEGQRAFEEAAVEASPHRDLIRSLGTGDPLSRGHRAAARWAHIRRKLGLEAQD